MRQQTLADSGVEKYRKKTRTGKQWYFGMKPHVGVDSKSKMIHSVAAAAANVQFAGHGRPAAWR